VIDYLLALGVILGIVWVGVSILTIKDTLHQRRHPGPMEPDGLGEPILRFARWDEVRARPVRILLVPVVIALYTLVTILFLPIIVWVLILRMLRQNEESGSHRAE
jgi:hypothetical protein